MYVLYIYLARLMLLALILGTPSLHADIYTHLTCAPDFSILFLSSNYNKTQYQHIVGCKQNTPFSPYTGRVVIFGQVDERQFPFFCGGPSTEHRLAIS